MKLEPLPGLNVVGFPELDHALIGIGIRAGKRFAIYSAPKAEATLTKLVGDDQAKILAIFGSQDPEAPALIVPLPHEEDLLWQD